MAETEIAAGTETGTVVGNELAILLGHTKDHPLFEHLVECKAGCPSITIQPILGAGHTVARTYHRTAEVINVGNLPRTVFKLGS